MAISQTTNGDPHAIDLSHHINAKSRARHPSPLKDIIRYMSQEGMISLAGGILVTVSPLCLFLDKI